MSWYFCLPGFQNSRYKYVRLNNPGGGGVLGLIFAGNVPLASQSPYPIIVSSVANYRPILVTFRQICNFRDPNLVTYYFYELTHFLDWIKNTLLFIYSTKILLRLLTVNTLFFFYKNVVFPGQAEYCYFPADFRLKIFLYYRKSSIKPPGGLIFCKHFWGGGLKERGGAYLI